MYFRWPVVLAEGGDLRAPIRRARQRAALLLTVVSLVATPLVLVASPVAGAPTRHARVRVPNVLDMNQAQVDAAMRQANLFYQTRGPGSSNRTWVRVVAESPRPGTIVAWHSSVTFTTARRSRARVGHVEVRVPRVVHMTKAAAYATLRRAGLYFRARGPGSSNGTWVRVTAQSLRPGRLVPWHTIVVLGTAQATNPVSALASSSVPRSPTNATHATTSATSNESVRYRTGIATWYAYFPGRCATSYLPMGTHITVRDVATGRSVQCVVTDRQGSATGRVVDLNETQFSQLAPLSQGVVLVKVTW